MSDPVKVIRAFRQVLSGIQQDLEFLQKRNLPEAVSFVEKMRLRKKLDNMSWMTFQFLDKTSGFGKEIKAVREEAKEVAGLL